MTHDFYQKYYPELYNCQNISENFETVLVNVRFQLCLAVESIGQDGAVLPYDKANQIAGKQGRMSSHRIIIDTSPKDRFTRHD